MEINESTTPNPIEKSKKVRLKREELRDVLTLVLFCLICIVLISF
jgi:hypothetical protein